VERFNARRVVGIDSYGDLICRGTGRRTRKPALHPQGHRGAASRVWTFYQANPDASYLGGDYVDLARPIIVDIDIVADGAAETYSFMCVVTRETAFVQRTMN
jgi:hypothetical protein